ncbi:MULTISPECIES: hypothetical protein [unclassified Streptomyces]|uniref:hypothetical protein n=1 Tax=unclassified Streptomyces TaxID=2593676 RepID=UPI00074910CD|nr:MULTISPECIES: hypothetical protein [unclassified Streptomyces]KUL68033.1 hypothetical protein ADL34_34285 [Streptomyces sp. NRRL WC-3605]KUL77507.1 hypothetical protein ADL33_10815 [Streptomyces sp. NRRL WC-3604]
MNTERPENDDTGASGGRPENPGAPGAGGPAETGAREGAKAGEERAPEDADAGEAQAPEDANEAQAGAPKDADAGDGGPDTNAEGAQQAEAAGVGGDAVGGDVDGVTVGVPGLHGGRRRSPAVIASVAAAVLLVGGGGAYLAANASGGSDGSAATGAPGGSAPPPLRLDGAGEGGASNGIAPGEPNPYGVRYRAGGDLPDGPGSAPVYRAAGQVGADDVERLAEALGVDGTPVSRGQTWHIGAKDGSGPTLRVDKQAPGSWTFQRFAAGTDDCRGVAGCAKTPPSSEGDPPAEDAAEKAAEPVLEAVGQDEAKLDASQVTGSQRVVNAEPVVDGLPTYGWTTGVTVNAQGEVVGGSGLLAAPVKGDTYPVLSAEKTLGLMNKAPVGGDGRGGIGGCADPVPLKEQPEANCDVAADPSVKTKQDTVTVEKAVFGLAAHAVDGRQALVPSWLFQVRAQDARDGFTVTYPAVDPAYLATPSEEPTTGPSPRPSGPKDDPSASPVTRNVTVEGYTADGRDLTVTFTGGVCAHYDVTASESGGTVTVRVTETTRPEKVCILIAKVFHRTVQLDAPLGDRRVVGTDGQGVPLEKPGARLPATPQTSGAR